MALGCLIPPPALLQLLDSSPQQHLQLWVPQQLPLPLLFCIIQPASKYFLFQLVNTSQNQLPSSVHKTTAFNQSWLNSAEEMPLLPLFNYALHWGKCIFPLNSQKCKSQMRI